MTVKNIKIFIASAGEVKAEREKAVLMMNNLRKAHRHLDLEAIEWEYDIAPGNQPGNNTVQKAINPLLEESHILVFIFYSRIGQGTKEEFELATRLGKKFFLLFKKGFSPRNKTEIAAYAELLEFKERLNISVMYQDYNDENDFDRLLYQSMNLYLSITHSSELGLLPTEVLNLKKLQGEKEDEIKELKEYLPAYFDNDKLGQLGAEIAAIKVKLAQSEVLRQQYAADKATLEQQVASQNDNEKLKAQALEQLLNNNIINDPHWALAAIYEILKRDNDFYDNMYRDYLGRVRLQDLFKAFGKDYSTDQKWLFLGFMESLRLCFALSDSSLPDKSLDRYYIFPQFLPSAATPAVEHAWANATAVQTFYCTVPYLDYYRIQQFIVTLGNKTPVQFIWKNGILVTTNLGMFMVTANQPTNTIQVQMEQKAVAMYLPYIIETFESDTGQQNKAVWMQGSDVATATPVDMEALHKQVAEKERLTDTRESSPKKQYGPMGEAATQTGHQLTELPNVKQQRPKRLVISYASEDRAVLDELKVHTNTYRKDGRLELVFDREWQDGKRYWHDRIKEMFASADGFLILRSHRYQDTDRKQYIWEHEVKEIAQQFNNNKKAAKQVFVFCLNVSPANENPVLDVFDNYTHNEFGRVLPAAKEDAYDRDNFLIDFVQKIIRDKFLKS